MIEVSSRFFGPVPRLPRLLTSSGVPRICGVTYVCTNVGTVEQGHLEIALKGC